MLEHVLGAGHNFLCKITNIHLPLQNKQLLIKHELLFLTERKSIVIAVVFVFLFFAVDLIVQKLDAQRGAILC